MRHVNPARTYLLTRAPSRSSINSSLQCAIRPLYHTWAQRCLWLASVGVIDRRKTVCPSHPKSRACYVHLALDGCGIIRTHDLQMIEQTLFCWITSDITHILFISFFFFHRKMNSLLFSSTKIEPFWKSSLRHCQKKYRSDTMYFQRVEGK